MSVIEVTCNCGWHLASNDKDAVADATRAHDDICPLRFKPDVVTPAPLDFDELVEACDDCDGLNWMCSEHRHLSKAEEDEQAAKWRREDDLDAQAADREHRAEDDSLWVEP